MLDNVWSDWAAWWATVTPEFAFLLALPLAVAAAGLLAEVVRNRKGGKPTSGGRNGVARP